MPYLFLSGLDWNLVKEGRCGGERGVLISVVLYLYADIAQLDCHQNIVGLACHGCILAAAAVDSLFSRMTQLFGLETWNEETLSVCCYGDP